MESNSDSASSEQSNNVLEGIDSSITWQFGNFEVVEQYISDHVILKNQAISMRILQEIYGLRPDDARYRNQLKKRIVSAFGKKKREIPNNIYLENFGKACSKYCR